MGFDAGLGAYALTWNGTAVNETVGDVTRTLLAPAVWTPSDIVYPEDVVWRGIRRQSGEPIVPPMLGQFNVLGTYSGGSSDPDLIGQVLRADWRKLQERYSTRTGALGTLEIDDEDADGSTAIERLAYCQVLRAPSMDYALRAAGNEPGFRMRWFIYPVFLRVPSGVFVAKTATSTTQTATTGGATIVFADDALTAAGARVEIGAVSSATSLTIAYDSVTRVTITTPTTSDFFDFGYTTEGAYDDGGTGTIGALDWLDIPAGGTTLTLTTNAGTASVTVRYKPRTGSW